MAPAAEDIGMPDKLRRWQGAAVILCVAGLVSQLWMDGAIATLFLFEAILAGSVAILIQRRRNILQHQGLALARSLDTKPALATADVLISISAGVAGLALLGVFLLPPLGLSEYLPWLGLGFTVGAMGAILLIWKWIAEWRRGR